MMREDYPLRRAKILDHLVFCGWYDKYKDWILQNPLSLEPRKEKLSTKYPMLESMLINSIKTIEKAKNDGSEANKDKIE